MKKFCQGIFSGWNEWWFSPRSLLNLAVVRILVTGTCLFLNLSKWRDWDIFYSDSGLVPRKVALEMIPEFFRPPFVWFVWPDSWVPGVLGLQFGLLVLSLLGIGSRYQLLVIWLIFVGFMQRNFSVVFGAELVASAMLLYLGFCDCFSKLTVWKKKEKKEDTSDLGSAVFYRMMQVQLCVIYAYSGFEKLKGGSWWDGTATWTVIANPQMSIFDLSWLRHVPIFLVILTFSTVIFEIYFPIVVWLPKLRRLALLTGFAFHLGIGLVLSLPTFAVTMLAPYILFLEAGETEHLLLWLKNTVSKRESRPRIAAKRP